MALQPRDAGTLQTITRGRARIGGVVRELREFFAMDGGVLRTVATFADLLTASASPTTVSGTQGSASPIAVNTTFTTATPVGGRAPFTYSWAQVTGSTAAANSPSMATTNFARTVAASTTDVTTFRCTVTDAVGQVAATNTITATFTNTGGGGAGS